MCILHYYGSIPVHFSFKYMYIRVHIAQSESSSYCVCMLQVFCWLAVGLFTGSVEGRTSLVSLLPSTESLRGEASGQNQLASNMYMCIYMLMHTYIMYSFVHPK